MNAPSPKPPTIRDLARLAGVSKTTVSDALRNDGRVTAKTRVRIQGLARKMGYVPNTVATALASSKKSGPIHSLRIAVINHLPPQAKSMADRPFQAALEQLGYHADLFHLASDGISPTSLRKILYHRGYSGVVFQEVRAIHSELYAIDWDAFSVVCANRTFHRPPFDVVRNNPFDGISVAAREIRRSGYTRIGFLICRYSPPMLDDFEREGALAVFQQQLSKNESALPPYLGPIDDAAAIEKWVRRCKPDALAGFNGIHSMMLRQRGFRIPQDITYANLHPNCPADEAYVDTGDLEVPALCADHLDQMIRHKRLGAPKRPREIFPTATWVPGPSLPAKSD